MAYNSMRFENETFTVRYLDTHKEVIGLSGWRRQDGDIEFDHESARRYARAGDELVLAKRQAKPPLWFWAVY